MSTHLISITIKPFSASESSGLTEIIAFQEGDEYYLVGVEEVVEELKALLPDIQNNNPRSIKMKLEIRPGNEIDAESYQDFLSKMKPSEEE
ncbi:MAG: hypothetical protein QNJ32_23540 [Xenococcaceae cyanobacterium MO_167.B27]|nr:hypothetical protein [Xenococcaceae cyanobacterium MO_167.B27]